MSHQPSHATLYFRYVISRNFKEHGEMPYPSLKSLITFSTTGFIWGSIKRI